MSKPDIKSTSPKEYVVKQSKHDQVQKLAVRDGFTGTVRLRNGCVITKYGT